MTKRNDGGPAFPCMAPENIHPGSTSGMDLSDWFAGQAINQILRWDFAEGHDYNELAEQAYKVADAMIAERLT